MHPPPILPGHRLQRVLTIARVDGWSIVIIAGLSGLVTLIQGNWLVTLAAGLVVLTGAGELHGRRLLQRGSDSGLSWMIGAQLLLLLVIWIYAWCRWRYFDPAALWAELPGFVRTEVDRQLLTAGLDPALNRPFLLQLTNTLTCLVLSLVSVIYQGGMAIYYSAQRPHVRQALLASPPPLT